jgi:hypothetical protein
LIARAMHWRYEWVDALPLDVYGELVDLLTSEQQAQRATDADHGEI